MVSISVLMCVSNREAYVKDAIESILNQTFTDFEFIIVNDGSTDRSKDIIKHYEKLDKRIKYIENASNKGITQSLTIGLTYCEGKYIARMDSDDISLPERLKLEYEYLERNPEIDAVGSGYEFIEADGRRIGRTVIRPTGPILTRLMMFYYCVLLHPTVFMKASFFKDFNRDHLEEEFLAAEDYHFWMRRNFDSFYDNLPVILLYYRLHGGQLSNTEFTPQRDNSVYSAHIAFEKLLDKKISAEAIKTLCFSSRYTTTDPRTIVEAIMVVYRTQVEFEKKNKMTGEELKSTREYSYVKLKSIIMKYKRYPLAFICGVCFLFMLMPGQFIAEFFGKLIGSRANLKKPGK